MFGLGIGELIVLFFIAVIFVGPKRLPLLARSIGKSVREFQKAKDVIIEEVSRPHSSEQDNAPRVAHKVEVSANAKSRDSIN